MYRKYQKDEFYTRKAREEMYPARSVYKLQEIDNRYHIFKKGDKVLDLGSAPGSWLKYISGKVSSKGEVLGIDVEDVKIPLLQNVKFVKKDILDEDIFDLGWLKIKYDVVVSDLSPKTSGIRSLDVAKSLDLSEKAWEIAKRVLKPGGNFVCKIFEGEGVDKFFGKVSLHFKFAKRFRPKAVRKESREFYLVAIDKFSEK